ncbi:unnamed protein product [Peronospora farinosa]|uniref:Uncharacterized protein n=1 Tax=Peronospora farinosa TaxID=134698 RepID=A0AAV0T846_9STRA|nr:unnamed protein product [Peronospora farinosa]
MNALRSVINTTDVDPACRGACKKALEANACGIVEPNFVPTSEELAKQVDETKSKYADFEKQEAKLREELKYAKEQQKELQSMQKKELKKQKNNLGKKCTKMRS